MKNLILEANRCLVCKKAKCSAHCPILTPIPEVINLFKDGQVGKAGEILFKNNPLSLVCAIVCPHEDQCKGHCIRGIKSDPISFCDIEKHISTYYLENVTLEREEIKKERVAIIGGGPAGMTIAFILAQKGYKITIFDANDKIGGVLRYGIPDFRLPKTIIDSYEERLLEIGVNIRPNTLIGPVITIDRLLEDGYDAIFIGTGVWNPKTLGIKGETLGHVHYAIDYLKNPESYKLGEIVTVIGAGDVAMDAARTAKRKGAKKVYVMYRKGIENMPATKAEVKGAIEDGVEFELFKSPLEFNDEGIIYIETENSVDEDGRVITVNKNVEEKLFNTNSIIIAVSQSPKNNIVNNTKGIEINKWGLIVTDERGNTTRKGVFATGDVVTGAKTVVQATAHAKVVAEEIEKYLIEK